MKKIIVLAACLFAVTTVVNAQVATKAQATPTQQPAKEKLTPEQRAQKNVDRLNEIASLSEDQKSKVKELALARISKVHDIRQKYKGQAESKEIMHKEVEAAQAEYRKSVKAILTPEQLEKVKAKAKEQRAAKANSRAANASDDNVLEVND